MRLRLHRNSLLPLLLASLVSTTLIVSSHFLCVYDALHLFFTVQMVLLLSGGGIDGLYTFSSLDGTTSH